MGGQRETKGSCTFNTRGKTRLSDLLRDARWSRRHESCSSGFLRGEALFFPQRRLAHTVRARTKTVYLNSAASAGPPDRTLVTFLWGFQREVWCTTVGGTDCDALFCLGGAAGRPRGGDGGRVQQNGEARVYASQELQANLYHLDHTCSPAGRFYLVDLTSVTATEDESKMNGVPDTYCGRGSRGVVLEAALHAPHPYREK